MMGGYLFITYLGKPVVDFTRANVAPENYLMTPDNYYMVLGSLSFLAWLYCAAVVYWLTEFIPNGGNWKGAIDGYRNRTLIKAFFVAMKRNIFGEKIVMESKNTQATEQNTEIAPQAIEQDTEITPKGMSVGSFVVKTMIWLMIASWFALIPWNFYIYSGVAYESPWFVNFFYGDATLSDFGWSQFKSLVPYVGLMMLNLGIVYNAKLFLDGYGDILEPHNMDKLSAFLKIAFCLAIHIFCWYEIYLVNF